MTDPVHDLIVSNRAFAAHYARRLALGAGMAEHVDDAVSEAMVGLVEAAQRFDPARGTSFIAIARWYVLNRVGRFLSANRGAVRMASSTRAGETAIRIAKVAARLEMELGHAPGAEDFAADLNVPLQRVEDAIAMRRLACKPLSTTDGSEEEYRVAQSDDAGPEDQLADAEMAEIAHRSIGCALKSLTTRDADVIRSHHVAEDPETLAALGARYGVTKERIRQIEKRALPKFGRVAKAKAIELGWRR